MTEKGEDLILAGAIIVAIGTILTAVGQTKETIFKDRNGLSLVSKGNGVEAFGNVLQAIGRSKSDNPEKIGIKGSWIQAVGNSTNSLASETELNDSGPESIRINALGSGVQALGAKLEAIAVGENEKKQLKNLEVTGLELISIGAFLDAIGNLFLLRQLDEKGDFISLIGSWTQVIGASIGVFVATYVEEVEFEKKDFWHT
ncbi:DUF6944 family repetitive protein [Peribacillus alkalitolerans]|uniref:DUF6944 family repetitive protein n=1 Tax=Peribacillus alkalitolerans TaxID=1550385 RepID=UPI0013D467FB|nr:hypothetical protein [Peribacillus alkalitolerans]